MNERTDEQRDARPQRTNVYHDRVYRVDVAATRQKQTDGGGRGEWVSE